MSVTQPFPCFPDYDGPIEGVFGFVHDSVLAEFSLDIMERVRFYNRGGKPKHELETRRRCMVWLDPANQPWDELARQWAELDRQGAELDRQWDELARQRDELDRQWADHRQWAKLARQLAGLDRQLAGLHRQWAELYRQWVEHEPAILAQIKALVPDLPWDGHKLIFPEETA